MLASWSASTLVRLDSIPGRSATVVRIACVMVSVSLACRASYNGAHDASGCPVDDVYRPGRRCAGPRPCAGATDVRTFNHRRDREDDRARRDRRGEEEQLD